MDESRIIHILQDNYEYKISDISFNRDGGGKTCIVSCEEQKLFLKIAGTEQASFYDWVAIRHFQLQAAMVEI